VAPSVGMVPDNLAEAIRDGNALSSGRIGMRKVLLTLQVVLSSALLLGSGLFLETLFRLTHVELGFQPRHLWAVHLAGRAPWSIAGPEYFSELTDRIRQLPGVIAAGLGNLAPMEMQREFLE